MLLENHKQVLKTKAVKSVYFCVQRGEWYGLCVRCASAAVPASPCGHCRTLCSACSCNEGSRELPWAHACACLCPESCRSTAENGVIV